VPLGVLVGVRPHSCGRPGVRGLQEQQHAELLGRKVRGGGGGGLHQGPDHLVAVGWRLVCFGRRLLIVVAGRARGDRMRRAFKGAAPSCLSNLCLVPPYPSTKRQSLNRHRPRTAAGPQQDARRRTPGTAASPAARPAPAAAPRAARTGPWRRGRWRSASRQTRRRRPAGRTPRGAAGSRAPRLGRRARGPPVSSVCWGGRDAI